MGAELKCVHVAVGVIRRDGRVLIARRPDHLHQGGLLEFPGGKVEPGETVQAALARELEEETGLAVDLSAMTPLIGVRHDYGDKQVFLDVWEAESKTGDPVGREGQMIEWRLPQSLVDEDFPAANRAIIRALRLPRTYAITGAAADPGPSPDNFLEKLHCGLSTLGDSLCLLRAPGLSESDYRALADKALSACQTAGVPLMLHGSPALINEFPECAGIHLTAREAARHASRPIPARYWLAVSCHSADELRHAQNLGADFVTLGPVKPTASHPGAPAMGVDRFRALVAETPMVVFALGGLVLSDAAAMIEAGAQGVAGISYWWR